MTGIIGNYSLCAAVLVAAGTLLVSLRAARMPTDGLRRVARRGIYLLAALLTMSSGALLTAEVQSDFCFGYVARYTERALPLGYKIAAFWAGQEGSLLLWGWMLAVMALVFAWVHRHKPDVDYTIASGVLAGVIGFFAALMLFAANPFQMLDAAPVDGSGLNPMLQDPGMIAHPPVLFMGYAALTLPFAALIASLLRGRKDSAWLDASRIWTMVGWIFLGAGILLGAQWAYVELGWGGYWAWDPVENASLLPWLTGTALLHSAMAQRHRGMFKRWNALLAAGTFILCILGTYITRSGIVDSVHTFGQSLVGTFFGAFLVIITLLSGLLVAIRWTSLHPERPLQSVLSREGAFLAANILFTAMMLLTLLGTLFPAITRQLSGQSMSVSVGFYNRTILPLGIAAVAIMGLAPLLTYGSGAINKLRRGAALPLCVAGVALAALWVMGVHSAWALASAAVCSVAVAAIGADLCHRVNERRHNTREPLLNSILLLIDANHRRYGSHVVHAGLAMMVAGIAGSSLYTNKQMIQLNPGGSASVGKYEVKLETVQEVRGANYTAVEAALIVSTPAGAQTLRPQRRFYDKAEEASSEVALRSNWREDLYVTLAGWEDAGRVTTLQVIVNPLVRWIWAGGVVLTLGAAFCLTPQFMRKSKPAEAPAKAAPVAKPKRRKDRRSAKKMVPAPAVH